MTYILILLIFGHWCCQTRAIMMLECFKVKKKKRFTKLIKKPINTFSLIHGKTYCHEYVFLGSKDEILLYGSGMDMVMVLLYNDSGMVVLRF